MQSKRHKCSHIMMSMTACFLRGSGRSSEFLRQMARSRIVCVSQLYRILQISKLFCSRAVTMPTVCALWDRWYGVPFPWASARGHIEAVHGMSTRTRYINFRGLRPAATLKLQEGWPSRCLVSDFRGLRPAATLKLRAFVSGVVTHIHFRGLRPAATLKPRLHGHADAGRAQFPWASARGHIEAARVLDFSCLC